MRIRRLPHVVVAMATFVAPLAALAQSRDGSVTTAPFAAAPVMGMPVLILLAVVLTGVGAYLLRRAAGRVIAVIGFVAVLTALAGLGYATFGMMIMIRGAQCAMQTTQMFDPMGRPTLKSYCPNSIQIISIQQGMLCGTEILGLGDTFPPLCSVGQVLADGEECSLPFCVT